MHLKATPLFGGIEAGGTKFVCIVAGENGQVIDELKFPTTLPEETIGRAVQFFTKYAESGELKAIGIGSFGPVDLDTGSAHYGFITTTPKPNWVMTDLRGGVAHALRLPVAFDTDVNAAALGEYLLVEENSRLDPLLYITVGTGIGVGAIVNGQPVQGLVHPEMGHMLLPHDKTEDPFEGGCPYHKDCWEGLASGPAMLKRWGRAAETLPANHPGWDLEVKYTSLAIANLVCCYSPRRVILGGGVAQHEGLLGRVQVSTRNLLNGYIHSPAITEHIEDYIVSPRLGSRSGSLGAVALAIQLAGSGR